MSGAVILGRKSYTGEILSVLADEKGMTERLQRMSSTRWTTDEVFSISFVSLSFFQPLVVCLCWVWKRSFCLDDCNHTFATANKKEICATFEICHIYWSWATLVRTKEHWTLDVCVKLAWLLFCILNYHHLLDKLWFVCLLPGGL